MKIRRVVLILVVLLAAAWIYAEFTGSRLHAPRPGLVLLSEMLQIKQIVDDKVRESKPIDPSLWQLREVQHSNVGMKISVSSAGIIDGEMANLHIRLTPRKVGGQILWECEGTPVDQVPASCATLKLGRERG